MRIVIDTNLWVRALLKGPRTLPILHAWRDQRFEVVCSQELLEELLLTCQKPRLKARIASSDLLELSIQLQARAAFVELHTTPPNCRDPKDQPVLAAAIDGQAEAVVTGDSDLRADQQLREAMATYGVRMWGIDTLLEKINSE